MRKDGVSCLLHPHERTKINGCISLTKSCEREEALSIGAVGPTMKKVTTLILT